MFNYTDEDVERVAKALVIHLTDQNREAAMKFARAALSAMPRHVPEWMDIETAPKDGTRILIWTATRDDDPYVRSMGTHICMAQTALWDGESWERETIGDPTHWMPLPPAPLSEASDKPVSASLEK